MTLLMVHVSAQVDLHSHAITQGYLDYIKANGAELDEGFPIPGWDVEKHIAFMDKAGIQTSVLTMPAPQPFFGDAEAKEGTAQMVKSLKLIDTKPMVGMEMLGH